jgi:cobalamin biosynthesis protein CobT
MRTQSEVVSLIAAAARPFRTAFDPDHTDIRVDRAKKLVTVPLPSVAMSEADAESYLLKVYDAVALARWADDSAVLRNKEGELADPLAYEIGMRRAQAEAMDTWAGDAALYERHFQQMKGELSAEDWSGLTNEQQKAMAASLIALKNIKSTAVRDIVDTIAPPQVKRLVDSVDLDTLPSDSAKAAEQVRRILDIELPPEQEQEQEQEGEGESDGSDGTEGDSADGSGDPDGDGDQSDDDSNGESDGDGDTDGEGDSPEQDEGDGDKERDGKGKPKPERPDPTEKLKPKDYKPGEPAIGADGLGEFVCTPEEHVIIYDTVVPENNRNTSGNDLLKMVEGRSLASSERNLYLDKHLDAVSESGLSQHIRQLIQVKMRTRYETGKMSGKINRRAVHRLIMPTVGDGQWNAQVFRKKSVPKDTTNTAVCILVDYSGSMDGPKTEATIEAVGSLNQALTACHVKHAVYTFTEGYNGNDTTANCYGRSLLIGVAKHYDLPQQYEQVMRQMAWLSPHQHQNGDVDAVQWAYNNVMRRKEKRKVLIVLSDGYPASDRPGRGERALLSLTDKIYNEGKVELYGVGIMSDAPKKFYRNNVIVNDIKQLEQRLISLAQGLFDVE